MNNGCPKCNGLMITEITVAEGQWIKITRCVNCGEYECPPENRELRQINALVYRARERTKHLDGYTVYGIGRKRG